MIYGQNFRKDNIEYPIRTFRKIKFSLDTIIEIKNLLLYTDMSLKDIADKCNVSYDYVYNLNQGDFHRDVVNVDSYPIRKNTI